VDVSEGVLMFASARDFVALGCTCSTLHAVVTQRPSLWLAALRRDFPLRFANLDLESGLLARVAAKSRARSMGEPKLGMGVVLDMHRDDDGPRSEVIPLTGVASGGAGGSGAGAGAGAGACAGAGAGVAAGHTCAFGDVEVGASPGMGTGTGAGAGAGAGVGGVDLHVVEGLHTGDGTEGGLPPTWSPAPCPEAAEVEDRSHLAVMLQAASTLREVYRKSAAAAAVQRALVSAALCVGGREGKQGRVPPPPKDGWQACMNAHPHCASVSPPWYWVV
jgi:hypothetical protein